jgi:hypothetical protein
MGTRTDHGHAHNFNAHFALFAFFLFISRFGVRLPNIQYEPAINCCGIAGCLPGTKTSRNMERDGSGFAEMCCRSSFDVPRVPEEYGVNGLRRIASYATNRIRYESDTSGCVLIGL